MSTKTLQLSDELYHYLLAVSMREPEVLHRLRAETARHPRGGMQISPEQGQLMGLLLQLMGARRTIEIGVFTGYSTLWTALSIPAQGTVVACDISKEWTDVARRYWREAQVEHKITLRLDQAVKTLDMLLAEGQHGTYDFAFIDADKANYPVYYERVLSLLRPGGLVAFDNMLWNGRVCDSSVNDEDTRAIRAMNERLHDDERVALSLVPIGDGLTLAVKR